MDLITRAGAKEKGLTRFFTGKPCSRGHTAERSTSGGMCLECERLRDAQRKEYKAGLHREHYASRPEFREKIKQRDKVRWEKNKEQISARKKVYYQRTRERQIAKAVANYKANKAARNAAQYERERANPIPRICRSLLQTTLKRVKIGKNLDTQQMLGYSVEEFRKHIEDQFQEGMSWQNHGDWHVDHRKPVSVFIKEGITDMRIINALSNLQPLWATENLTKGNRYVG